MKADERLGCLFARHPLPFSREPARAPKYQGARASDAAQCGIDEVQVALDHIHTQIDRTYFRPTFVAWQPETAAS